MSAAEMGDELAQLKSHFDQGLLTEGQYQSCVDKAVAKYHSAGVSEPARRPEPRAEPRPERSDSYYSGAPAPRQAGAPRGSGPPTASGSYGYEPYPTKGGKGGYDSGRGYDDGGYGGKGDKSGKSGYGVKGGKGCVEPSGPVVKQVPVKTYPAFDPKVDRSAGFFGPMGIRLRDSMLQVLQERGGSALLVLCTASICSDLTDRLAYEELLGNLSPQAFEAFTLRVGGMSIVKETRDGTYMPQWYISTGDIPPQEHVVTGEYAPDAEAHEAPEAAHEAHDAAYDTAEYAEGEPAAYEQPQETEYEPTSAE